MVDNIYFEPAATAVPGDITGDGMVDDSDFAILAANLGVGVPSGSASVPEPATMVLLGLGDIAAPRRGG